MTERDVIVEAIGSRERPLTERTTVRLLAIGRADPLSTLTIVGRRGQVQLRSARTQIHLTRLAVHRHARFRHATTLTILLVQEKVLFMFTTIPAHQSDECISIVFSMWTVDRLGLHLYDSEEKRVN